MKQTGQNVVSNLELGAKQKEVTGQAITVIKHQVGDRNRLTRKQTFLLKRKGKWRLPSCRWIQHDIPRSKHMNQSATAYDRPSMGLNGNDRKVSSCHSATLQGFKAAFRLKRSY